jgi:tetratricopeptide (TPR) repeat protein
LPDRRRPPALDELAQLDAVRLFIERGRDVRADFALTDANAPAVVEICARLDGLPLAIELAAARLRLFTPEALLGRLGQRLAVLAGGVRDRAARQQTLRATMAWSYDLLDAGHQQLFRRMAVFLGGSTLAATEAVCNYDGQLQVDVFGGAELLMAHSLLQQREGIGGELRLWKLETIQAYAAEKLEGSGEGAALRPQHALYFLRLAETAEPQLRGAAQVTWLDRLEAEHDNLRAALDWSAAHDPEIELRLAAVLSRFWHMRGYFSEGSARLASALATAPALTVWRAKGLVGLGGLRSLQGKYTLARCALEEASAAYQALEDSRGMLEALRNLASLAEAQGDFARQRVLTEQCLALAQEVGETWAQANALYHLGIATRRQGDHARAQALFEQSLRLHQAEGDRRQTALVWNQLAHTAGNQGDHRRAQALYEQSLLLWRELQDPAGIAQALNNLGEMARQQHDYATARRLLEESLATFRQLGYKHGVACALHNLGAVAQYEGEWSQAEDLWRESLRLRRELGHKSAYVVGSLVGLAALAARPEASAAQLAWAARLLGAVDALREMIVPLLWAPDHSLYERALDAAQGGLDGATFTAMWAEGAAMSLEQAVACALEEGPDG